MRQTIRRLLDRGVPRRNIVEINFFDDRLHGLRHSGPGLVAEAYYSLYPEIKSKETVYFFFDEIQEIAGWEPFVDRLLRSEKCQVYMTGSSARMLSGEIATQMRGRALAWELFPFSFPEFLDRNQIAADLQLSSRKRLLVEKAFGEFWAAGGFPEVFGLSEAMRVAIHQEYLKAVILRDVVERHDVSHPRAVADLAHRLLDNVAALHSVNRLTGFLKSLGHKVPKASVSDYLDWFEEAYFLFPVRLYDPSLSRSMANPRKVYCVDHALVTSTSSGILVNSGHLLENLAFVAIRRDCQDVYYYRTRTGKEVDFVVPRRGAPPLLLQVCESLADPGTRKREIDALAEAMRELDLGSALVVTRSETDRLHVGGRTVDVVPVWRFLLERISNVSPP